jgi:biotin synthase
MNLQQLYSKSLKLEKITFEEALGVLKLSNDKLDELFNCSEKIRQKFFSQKIILCGIVNAKSGKCSEDCSFCAQSSHHKTTVNEYSLLSDKEILEAFSKAKENKINCFSIVTSGKEMTNTSDDFHSIINVLQKIKGIKKCTSLGLLSKEQAMQLKEAGLEKYHHNLETAKSFFPNMCTTHSYNERIQTIKNAKEAGLKVCVGGIFGIGETIEQRVELAMDISELGVDSVPLNFVHPIQGTSIYGKTTKMQIEEILKLIAMFRFIMPDKVIGVFGGRESSLGDRQKEIFRAGANSILAGNYLTVKGSDINDDLQMLKDLELETTDAR